jgi:hypothetical protein
MTASDRAARLWPTTSRASNTRRRPSPSARRRFGAQLENYWQYFDWQWSRGIDRPRRPSSARLPFSLLFLALGLAGLWTAWRADRAIFAYLLTLAGLLTFGLVVYLNFRYGYSLAPEITDPDLHEVRERDYFYVAGFLLWGVLAGMGVAWTWHTLARLVGNARADIGWPRPCSSWLRSPWA